MLLVLSRAACKHIAYSCNERVLRESGLIAAADTEELRLEFVRATLGETDPLMFDFTRTQLRVLDMLLTDSDPREGKLPDGTPVLELVEMIWRVLIGESGDAGHEDHHTNLDPGADAEAALRQS